MNRRLVPFAPLAVILPALLLSACDAAAPAAADDADREASGEVLEGSISDDMLPLEDLSSQPPVAAPLPGEASPQPEGEAGTESGGGTPAAAASAAAEPAADPPAEEAAAE